MNNQKYIIETHNLSIGYNQPLVSNINVNITAGEIILLAGKNGSGKSTLLKTFLKETSALHGTIKINGNDISECSFSSLARQVAVVLSKNSISPALKVFDLLALGRYPYKQWYQRLTTKEISNINEWLIFLQLEPYKDFHVHELSDGNLQKAMIARALIQDCPFIILDEPTSFLDIANKLEIISLLKHLAEERNKTILFTSHDLALGLSIADKVWLIKDNRLIIDYTEDLANKEDLYNYFSGINSNFNYSTNEFIFHKKTNKNNISVHGNSKNLFWLKKALLREGYQLNTASDICIKDYNNLFEIDYCNQKMYFKTIHETIFYLDSIFDKKNTTFDL